MSYAQMWYETGDKNLRVWNGERQTAEEGGKAQKMKDD